MNRRLLIGGGVFCIILVAIFLISGGVSNLASPSAPSEPQSLPQLVMINDPDGVSRIWKMAVDGSGQQFLGSAVVAGLCVVSSDEIAYGVYDPRGGGRLDVANATTGVTRTLVYDPEATLHTPVCLPNRQGIIFERSPLALADDEPQDQSLWRVNLDGSEAKNFLVVTDTASMNAQLAPGGSMLVFEDPRAEELRIATLDGVVTKRLPFNGTFSWSPDGQHIVVAVLNKAPAAARFDRLVVVNIQTDEQRTLIEDSQADHYYPRWSPDGRTIAFIRRPVTSMAGELWTMPAAGGGLPAATQITNDPIFDNLDPQWAPDSSTLMWSRVDDQEIFSVWRVNFGAGTPPQPTLLAENSRNPRWIMRSTTP